MRLKILELTKDNEEEYIDQVANLEQLVLDAMETEGKSGQLFITGKEDILEYAKSKENTVFVAIDENNKVKSATYITQGQKPFTYNDITKYFKYGEDYKKYVKDLYPNTLEYQSEMLTAYKEKVKAYMYAKQKIKEENPEYKDIEEFLKQEILKNEFHEKSILREKLNQYMSEYILKLDSSNAKERYERFFWTSANDIAKEMDKYLNIDFIKNEKVQEYEKILENLGLEIHEEPNFSTKPYYLANTTNSIEIDTYLTDPNQRHAGIARILVYEGIKKHIKEHFKNQENKEIFLCSTLHRDNLSSKYVSEFFGLKDSLYVKRRQGRDREVHICRIEKDEANNYLENMQNKLAVLYGYNPENKKITDKKTRDILEQQIQYEKQEFLRLNKIRHDKNNYKGNVKDIINKENKIINLKNRIKEIDNKGVNFGGDER